MTDSYDLIIRGGSVIDGGGGPAFEADVAINGATIAAVGAISGAGIREIDARGKLVTPGFVDIHTHYDGQATWEQRMVPSSNHGVTTVVAGNCGVGFAPCRPDDRQKLIALMEGVEDVPEVVMAEGVPWNWETFPEYMDALALRELDVDIAVQLPHSPLRVYVMGQRGVDREPSTEADRAEMRRLTHQAITAGALGVSTSRSSNHRRRDGKLAPSVDMDLDELLALANGLKDAGSGVFQLIPEVMDARMEDEFRVIEKIARASDRPVSFTLILGARDAESTFGALDSLEQARSEGLRIAAQIYPRPIGFLFGLDLSFHPFSLKPGFRPLESLPLSEKVAAMRDPDLRARLLAEERQDPNPMVVKLCSNVGQLHVLGDPPNYAPDASSSVAAIAAKRGISIEEAAYDLLLTDEGRTILYMPATNFLDGKLDGVRRLLAHPDTVVGLGDGGAHYGLICDASYPTFMLTHWTRDAAGGQAFDLPWTVRALSSVPARCVGLHDRGLVAPGFKADLNVIDYDRLALLAPRVIRDLPAGGKRLRQTATGYAATIVSGRITYRDGQPTDELPGRLVRGARTSPSARA